MICVCLAEKTAAECRKALKGIEFAEIRLDGMNIREAEIEGLFGSHPNLIATCRPGRYDRNTRLKLLTTAVSAGAAYVDIEVETDDGFKKTVVKAAQQQKCRVIVSYHNTERTPARSNLMNIIRSCFASGGDLAKIACKVNEERENIRLLSLLEDVKELLVIGLGDRGRVTRLIAPLLGSPFTFASLSKGKETAEGQLDWKTLKDLIETLRNV